MTTFRTAVFGYFSQHTGMMWLLLLLPIALSMGISVSATRNPTGSFIMLMVLSIMYGVEFALLAGFYTGADITAAFVSSATIFVVMALYGTLTKRSLDRFGAHATAALIALILASLINMFLNSPAITYIFSYIAVIIFVVLTAYDAQKMKTSTLTTKIRFPLPVWQLWEPCSCIWTLSTCSSSCCRFSAWAAIVATN